MLVGNIVSQDMMDHTSEWRNTCSCTDQEKVFLQIMFMQYKNSLWSAKSQFTSNYYIVKYPWSACPVFKQHNDQLKNIGPIGPACYRITAPALIGFFMNREIQCYKLARFKIKRSELGNFDPVSAGVISFIFNSNNFSGSPGLNGHCINLMGSYKREN